MGKKKTLIEKLEAQIEQANKRLQKLNEEERKARARWTKGYQSYRKAAKNLAGYIRRIFGENRYAKFVERVLAWDEKTVELTKERDKIRNEIKKMKEKLQYLKAEKEVMQERIAAAKRETDEIVQMVFDLTAEVREAIEKRERYIARHLFKKFADEETKQGRPRSQLTLISSDSQRKVLVRRNYITEVQPHIAEQALELIEQFFSRFREETQMDENTQSLYDLTQQLLVIRRNFKVGPQLYIFLQIDIDPEAFPELYQAQKLLGSSLRSTKTNKYIKLYEKDENDNWIEVPTR
jgi:hypothetical protein